MIFYQLFWEIVGHNVVALVIGIVHGIRPSSSLNSTNVALIPKVKSPTLVFDFQPISLYNVIYRLASKVLANRLKILLHVCSGVKKIIVLLCRAV